MTLASVGSVQYATFYVRDLFLGVEVTRIVEVLRPQELTEVPLAPRAVRGLMNLRGQLVMAVDTAACLGFDLPEAQESVVSMVVRAEGGVVSLLVDQMGDVLAVQSSSTARLPQHLPPQQRAQIQAVYDVPEGLLLILDVDYLLNGLLADRTAPKQAERGTN